MDFLPTQPLMGASIAGKKCKISKEGVSSLENFETSFDPQSPSHLFLFCS